jgi:hypothetical protein
MKKYFIYTAFVFLLLCFGTLALMSFINEPLSKIGAVVFALFGLLYHIFNSLANNTER